MLTLIDRRTTLGRLTIQQDEYTGALFATLASDKPPAIGTQIRPMPNMSRNAGPDEFTHTIGDELVRVQISASEIVALLNASPSDLDVSLMALDQKGNGQGFERVIDCAHMMGLGWPVFAAGLRGYIAGENDGDEGRLVFRLGPYPAEKDDWKIYQRALLHDPHEPLLHACIARLRAAGHALFPTSKEASQ